MPVDPNTGNRLPYKGEPGYDEAKKKFPDLYAAEEAGEEPEMPGDEGPDDAAVPDAAPDEIIPERDLKPVMDKADEMLAKEEAKGDMEEGDMEEPAAEEDMPEDTGASDVQPLMETLGMSQERAEEMMMAAKSIPTYAEMSASELADLLSRDFQVMMELERAAAAMAKPQPAEGEMMAEAPPMV